MELARIDNLRGTNSDDPGNWWWAGLYDNVPALQRLSPNVANTKTKGNVVEAVVGASFVASHELRQRRFHFRTEPPDALALAAAIFDRFAACGVNAPPLIPRQDYAGIPAVLVGGSPRGPSAASSGQPSSSARPSAASPPPGPATPAPGPASAPDFEEYIEQVCRQYPDIYERAKADALNRNPFGGDAITAPAAPAADAFSGEQPAPSSASAAAGAPSAPDAEDVWCPDDEEVIETRWDRR